MMGIRGPCSDHLQGHVRNLKQPGSLGGVSQGQTEGRAKNSVDQNTGTGKNGGLWGVYSTIDWFPAKFPCRRRRLPCWAADSRGRHQPTTATASRTSPIARQVQRGEPQVAIGCLNLEEISGTCAYISQSAAKSRHLSAGKD